MCWLVASWISLKTISHVGWLSKDAPVQRIMGEDESEFKAAAGGNSSLIKKTLCLRPQHPPSWHSPHISLHLLNLPSLSQRLSPHVGDCLSGGGWGRHQSWATPAAPHHRNQALPPPPCQIEASALSILRFECLYFFALIFFCFRPVACMLTLVCPPHSSVRSVSDPPPPSMIPAGLIFLPPNFPHFTSVSFPLLSATQASAVSPATSPACPAALHVNLLHHLLHHYFQSIFLLIL